MIPNPLAPMGLRMVPGTCVRIGLLTLLALSPPGLRAQSVPSQLAHVRWPLLDLVVIPDSCIGVWLLVAPSPASAAWASRTRLVSFEVDPVEALQWATVARSIALAESDGAPPQRPAQTPPLRPTRGARLMILARNSRTSKPKERFILAVSDSTSDTHWRALASAAQVEDLVGAIERTAEHARSIRTARDSTDAHTENDPALDSPVAVEFVPSPEYPRDLVRGRIDGEVWLEYIVGPDGRAEEGSFRSLLSHDPRFTRSAIRALYQGRFRPARSGGRPVRQRVFQVVSFRNR